jgi:mono/diheme cytochrome c family protein
MPSFADTLGDAQIGEIVAYLRTRFSSEPQWRNIPNEVARIRREETSP